MQVDGPEAVVAEVICDFNSHGVPCSSTLSTCVPGNYTLQLWQWQADANNSTFTEETRWRLNARINRVLLSSPIEVVPPEGLSGSDPSQPLGWCSAGNPVFGTGHWVDIDCEDEQKLESVLPGPKGRKLCKDHAALYTSPKGVTWSKFTDWAAFFKFFQTPNFAPAGQSSIWIPSSRRAMDLNDLAGSGLSHLWAHLSGDSVSFEGFTAIFR